MLKRLRKSSSHISLVLIGVAGMAALAGCSNEETRRDLYASREDCLADWGNTPQQCTPAHTTTSNGRTTTYYHGAPYVYSGNAADSRPRSNRAVGTSTTSRGGFGSSGRSSSS